MVGCSADYNKRMNERVRRRVAIEEDGRRVRVQKTSQTPFQKKHPQSCIMARNPQSTDASMLVSLPRPPKTHKHVVSYHYRHAQD